MSIPRTIRKNQPRNKSSKKMHNCPIYNKQQMWNMFDDAMIESDIECTYSKNTIDSTFQSKDLCDYCDNILSYSEEGFLVCNNSMCGALYKDVIDQGPEWRYYGNDDTSSTDPSRCGMPINPLLVESSFGSKVRLNFQKQTSYHMYRIQKYTEYLSMPHKEKAQFNEFQRISTMAQQSGIPKIIIDSALYFNKQISESDNAFRGDNKDGVIAASVYMACRHHNYPRTAKEIAAIFHLNVSSATHGCTVAQFIMSDIEKNKDHQDRTYFCHPKPRDFVERYCTRLNINPELTKLCEFITIKINNKGFMSENTPNSIAAGVIYFICQICKLNITKKDVKNISDISEVTINKCSKRIGSIQSEIIPNIIIQKYKIDNKN